MLFKQIAVGLGKLLQTVCVVYEKPVAYGMSAVNYFITL